MNKYVFCDLDYTLLDNDMNISKENFNAIKSFESRGNHFILCSGRVPFALNKYKEFLSSKEAITANGAVIISNNEYIKNQLLTKEAMKIITDYALKNGIYVRYFTRDIMYILNMPIESKAFVYPESEVVNKNNIYEVINNKPIIKLVFSSDDRNVLTKIYNDIDSLGLDIEMVFSADIFLEVNSKNQNKGNGVLDYCQLNNIDIKDTISIGDNDNDLPMLKVTNYSACPSNSVKKVKDIVDYVCTNDNNHNAIAEVLKKVESLYE